MAAVVQLCGSHPSGTHVFVNCAGSELVSAENDGAIGVAAASDILRCQVKCLYQLHSEIATQLLAQQRMGAEAALRGWCLGLVDGVDPLGPLCALCYWPLRGVLGHTHLVLRVCT